MPPPRPIIMTDRLRVIIVSLCFCWLFWNHCILCIFTGPKSKLIFTPFKCCTSSKVLFTDHFSAAGRDALTIYKEPPPLVRNVMLFLTYGLVIFLTDQSHASWWVFISFHFRSVFFFKEIFNGAKMAIIHRKL
jgi:hypothetical protein